MRKPITLLVACLIVLSLIASFAAPMANATIVPISWGGAKSATGDPPPPPPPPPPSRIIMWLWQALELPLT